jgi:hypothetical protein
MARRRTSNEPPAAVCGAVELIEFVSLVTIGPISI